MSVDQAHFCTQIGSVNMAVEAGRHGAGVCSSAKIEYDVHVKLS